MKRIFVAVKINPEQTLIRIYNSLKSVLGGEKINWTDPSNIHLTLAFLGDTEDELIKMVSIMLKQKCTGFGCFRFNLTGAGVFKNYRDPKVIWAGIESNEKLSQLNEKIMTGLKDAGFSLDERPFKPHLTLGRIKSIGHPDILKSALEKYQDVKIQEVEVKEVTLFESILKPAGPVYKSISEFSLE
ncbi:MAG: RNA 2',3'-cyclic phosphodiesterase [Bacteroidales bacterium]|jgi:2'-5' RNA ligase|nr:RNA 2',3'-cyclic phosphodiesterase [Bacteroidales bacterium]